MTSYVLRIMVCLAMPVIVFFALCPPLHGGEGAQGELEELFKNRYGTKDDRPDEDVLLRRCFYDLETHLTVQHSQMMFPDYYIRVVDLLSKHAKQKHNHRIQKLINKCGRIARSEMEYDGSDETASFVEVGYIWITLSETWIKYGLKDLKEKERHGLILKSMTKGTPILLDPWAIEGAITKEGKSIRDGFYNTIFKENLRPFLPSLARIMSRKEFWPTDDIVQKLLHSKHDGLKTSTFCFLLYADIKSKHFIPELKRRMNSNKFGIHYETIGYIDDCLNSNELNNMEKVDIFTIFSDGLSTLERMFESNGRFEDEDGDRVISVSIMAISCMSESKGFFRKNPDLILKMKSHVDWYERAIEKLDLRKHRAFYETVEDARRIMKSWSKE
jgi:hypothetical protein